MPTVSERWYVQQLCRWLCCCAGSVYWMYNAVRFVPWSIESWSVSIVVRGVGQHVSAGTNNMWLFVSELYGCRSGRCVVPTYCSLSLCQRPGTLAGSVTGLLPLPRRKCFCNCVCLFVCPLAGLCENFQAIIVKSCRIMCYCHGEKCWGRSHSSYFRFLSYVACGSYPMWCWQYMVVRHHLANIDENIWLQIMGYCWPWSRYVLY